ncbi:MAG: hypothetical protein EOM21_21275, partial [Gammaproteobacteria bacterium]|nr:hypothetical protein [Gammaproteobacteria bacterium]
MSVTPDELKGLSDDERLALEGEDDEAIENVPEEEDDADDEGGGEEQQAAPAPVEEPPAPQQQQEPFIPVYQAQPVEGYDAKLAELAERKKNLRSQYQDGDLDLDQYEDQRDAVDSEILALRESNLKASLAAEQAQQVQAQRWQWEVQRFLDENPYIKENRSAFVSVDALIIDLRSDPKHAGKPNRWYLDEAKRMYESGPRGSTTATTKTPSPTQKAAIPPNLGDMPAAELSETSGSEWA